MTGKRSVIGAALALGLIFAAPPGGAARVLAQEAAAPVTVEYENLRELVRQGNLSVSQTVRDFDRSVADYQEMYDILKWEQSSMETEADQREEDGDPEASLYDMNASMFKNSAKSITNMMDNMTDERATRSMEKQIDAAVLTAQTLMNSYNQMALTAKAQEKNAEALKNQYESAVRQNAVGMATQAQVEEAKDAMDQAVNSAASASEQARELRTSLLNYLGLEDTENVTIGTVPEPDLAAIEAVDYETDKNHAIGNSAQVQSARHAGAATTYEKTRRFQSVAEAEGLAQADYEAAYQSLAAARVSYEAARDGYESARLEYEALERRQQAGMLSQKDYLSGQAQYLTAQAQWQTASMNLVQSFETYRCLVNGVA